MLSDVAEQPFPAAITTPVSTAMLLGGALHSWSVALSMRIGAAGAGLRRVSGTIAAKVTDRLARVRTTAWRRPAPIDPIEPAGPSEQSRPLNSAIAAVSRYVAARENWRRLSGMVALAAAFAVLFAYGGGAMITRMAGTSTDTRANTSATSAVTRQLDLADKATQTPRSAAPVPPAPTSNIPPTEPTARAAFYLARAKAGDVAAQYDIGVLYARGDGLVQDYAGAASWFHAAAAQGNIAAEYNLGVLYQRGLGVAADKTEALNWYRSAAGRSDPAAQFNLALAYAQGNGTPQDLAAAARWYQRAAEQGVAAAMVNLAILYEKGSGLDRSPTEAYAWYSAAGERGDSGAKARAGALFQQFNDKDKAHAEGLAATIGAALDSPPSPA
jgi:TPR repeat protein